jgi:hypothetical protein
MVRDSLSIALDSLFSITFLIDRATVKFHLLSYIKHIQFYNIEGESHDPRIIPENGTERP